MYEESFVSMLVTVAVIAIPVLVGLLVFLLRPYLLKLQEEIELRLSDQQFQLLRDILGTLIHAAEQLTDLDTDEKKKGFVLKKARELADKYQIPISDEQLDTLLEGVLKEIKGFKPDIDTD